MIRGQHLHYSSAPGEAYKNLTLMDRTMFTERGDPSGVEDMSSKKQ